MFEYQKRVNTTNFIKLDRNNYFPQKPQRFRDIYINQSPTFYNQYRYDSNNPIPSMPNVQYVYKQKRPFEYFLLGIVTCNIWNVYWAYKVGKSGMEIQKMNNDPGSDQSILYLILTLLGWEIVVWALVQNDINKYVDTHGGAEVQPQA